MLAAPLVAPGLITPRTAAAAPAGNGQVVAYLVSGVGNGHGRGLSQWGAYGRAVNAGQSWDAILDTYYGGTTSGIRGDGGLRVRLTDWDNSPSLGVISKTTTARWNGSAAAYASLHAAETTPNRFNVYGSAAPGCSVVAEPVGGFSLLAENVVGPIVFTTDVDPVGSPGGNVLGVCDSSGGITHYRGSVELRDTADGNRVVNQLDVELYLRGVIPKEVFPAWGTAGDGRGMNALKAQAVAARSFALSQNRYSYAKTCDTTSCQVYGGAATSPTPTSAGFIGVEHTLTNQAIAETSGVVRLRNDAIVSTEFSASNGPRTAGGIYPPVDDPWDDVPGNPLHRWTRLIDADAIASKYGLPNGNGIATVRDSASTFDGIWSNKVVRGTSTLASAWDFRNAFGLPSPGYELIPITRDVTSGARFAFIGDSVGVSVAGQEGSELRVMLDGVFGAATYDAIGARRTQGGSIPDGVSAAAAVPIGTELVLVELGYNDDPKTMASRIDAVMTTLRGRQVGRVAWVNVSQRRPEFAATNAAIAAATGRWDRMFVFDWHSASSGPTGDRWFADNVHLTATGRAEFARFLRDRLLPLASVSSPRTVLPGSPLRVPVLGRGGVPGSGVVGVALNVTAVDPAGGGWLRVWPCGSPEPETSSVNYAFAGAVEPNAVVVPVDATGEVCVGTMTATEVVVDVSGWFDAALRSAAGRLVDTRLSADGGARSVLPGSPLRVPVLGRGGVPGSGVVGVALNVTAVDPAGGGWLRVWPCGSPEPETSSVNYAFAGAVEPNAVVVPVDATGEVCVGTMTATEVVVDVSGWFDAALRSAAGRLVDTRLSADGGARSVLPGSPLRVPVLGRGGVPGSGVVGVALNVTAVDPAGGGWLRVWPCGSPEPETSSVNYAFAGAVEPNAVVVPVDATGEVCVGTMTATEVVVDVSGWFDAALRSAAGRLVDTRQD